MRFGRCNRPRFRAASLPAPDMLNPKLYSPSTLNPKPQTLNPNAPPSTKTLNLKQHTRPCTLDTLHDVLSPETINSAPKLRTLSPIDSPPLQPHLVLSRGNLCNHNKAQIFKDMANIVFEIRVRRALCRDDFASRGQPLLVLRDKPPHYKKCTFTFYVFFFFFWGGGVRGGGVGGWGGIGMTCLLFGGLDCVEFACCCCCSSSS